MTVRRYVVVDTVTKQISDIGPFVWDKEANPGFTMDLTANQVVMLEQQAKAEGYIQSAALAPDLASVIRNKLNTALAANNTYLAIASPTNARMAQQVQLMTRELNGLIRLTLQALDADDS